MTTRCASRDIGSDYPGLAVCLVTHVQFYLCTHEDAENILVVGGGIIADACMYIVVLRAAIAALLEIEEY